MITTAREFKAALSEYNRVSLTLSNAKTALLENVFRVSETARRDRLVLLTVTIPSLGEGSPTLKVTLLSSTYDEITIDADTTDEDLSTLVNFRTRVHTGEWPEKSNVHTNKFITVMQAKYGS